MSRKKRKDKSIRGSGGSKFYVIRCAGCNAPVLLYQKDGPGALLRMYLDRILEPPELAALADDCATKDDVPNLACPECGAVLAVPMTHESGRLALRVIKGRLHKTRSDGSFPG
ncbi:MAG: hypothetical protein GYB65_23075 [Chloroflexi bacterium]|nr:hypothetical protein [Chloroflexota bacterium]